MLVTRGKCSPRGGEGIVLRVLSHLIKMINPHSDSHVSKELKLNPDNHTQCLCPYAFVLTAVVAKTTNFREFSLFFTGF